MPCHMEKFLALLVLHFAFCALLTAQSLKSRTLHCQRGEVVSTIWWREEGNGNKQFAVDCENVLPKNGCIEHCVWTRECNTSICGGHCYLRGLRINNEQSEQTTPPKPLFLCCNSTPAPTTCNSTECMGNPPVNQSCISYRTKLKTTKATTMMATIVGMDGISNLTGIRVVKQMDLSSKRVDAKACLDSECSEDDENALFQQFKDKFPGREMKMSEDQARQQFKDNLDTLSGLRTECTLTADDAGFDIGKFADMSLDQMIKSLGGTLEESGQVYYKPKNRILKISARYKAFSWKDMNVVPAVRDQRACGSCYAFSTSDLIAIQANLERHQTPPPGRDNSYAAQFIIDCFQAPQAISCVGGRPASLLKFLIDCGDDCALPSEKCYQYKSKAGNCNKGACQSTKTGRVRHVRFLKVDHDKEKETMAALLRWGPALTTVEVSPAWQMYNGKGVIRSYHCGKKTNHAVTIVGYDYTGPVPYYIVRNSWGPDWGDGGYAKVEAGQNSCGIAKGVIFICVEKGCENIKTPDYMALHPNAPK